MKKHTQESFIEKVEAIHGDSITPIGKYKGYHTNVKFKCNSCSLEYFKKPSNVIRNRRAGCPECTKQRVIKKSIVTKEITKERFQFKLDIKFPDIKLLNYVDYNTNKADFECSHGHKFSQIPKWMFATKYGCSKCGKIAAGRNQAFSSARIKDEIKTIHGNLLKLKRYAGTTNGKSQFYCMQCDRTWVTSAASVLAGSGCRVCNRNKSNNRTKKVVHIEDRKVIVEGGEHKAITILKKEKYKMDELYVASEGIVPTFSYVYKDRIKRYFPDMYYKPNQEIIEVKSTWTLGLYSLKSYTEGAPFSLVQNKKKARAVLGSGFVFRLIVIDRDKLIELPENWIDLTKKEIRLYLRQNSIVLP